MVIGYVFIEKSDQRKMSTRRPPSPQRRFDVGAKLFSQLQIGYMQTPPPMHIPTLIEAVRTNQIALVESYVQSAADFMLLKAGANPDFAGDYKRTALHVACNKNYESIVDALIEVGADVNAQTATGLTALMLAVKNNSLSVARKLLGAGADASVRSREGFTAREVAEAHGFWEMAAILGDV